jgi:hypothetical protein
MRDIEIKLLIEVPEHLTKSETDQYLEISYVVNECCSKLEDLKCQVMYQMLDDRGRKIELPLP